MNFPHEYLAHGVITGPAHKALPFKVFCDAGINFKIRCGPPISMRHPVLEKITPQAMETARRIGDQYGGDFALPMCLAVVCREKRDPMLFRNGVQELDIVLKGIADLPIPQKCSSDKAIQPDAEYVERSGDVEQLCRLMRALLEHPQANRQPKKRSRGDVAEGGEAKRTRAKKKRRLKDAEDEVMQEQEEEKEKANDEEEERAMKRLRREEKRLEIDVTL